MRGVFLWDPGVATIWRSVRLWWLRRRWRAALKRWGHQSPAEKAAWYQFNKLNGRGPDPEDQCDGWDPRPATLQDFPDCETDGHYCCHECARRSPTKELEEGL